MEEIAACPAASLFRRRRVTFSVMTKYVIEIPDEVRVALEERASVTGSDVSQVIRMVVESFVRNGAVSSTGGRLPDPPLEAPEILPPCDLPKTSPRPIPIQRTSQRIPDPLVDIA